VFAGLAGFAFVGVVAACSSFSGEDPPPADGGHAVPDGAPDTTTTDGGGEDARDGGLDASTRPCAEPHWLCDDFDRDGATIGWIPNVVGDASVTIIGAASAPSPPNVLEALAHGGAVATLNRTAADAISRFQCSFSMRVVQRDTTFEAYFLDVQLPTAALNYRLGLSLAAAPAKTLNVGVVTNVVGSDAGASITNGSAQLADGAWARISLEVQPAVPRAAVRIDGTAIVNVTSMPASGPVTQEFFVLGPAASSAQRPWIIDFDDVVCDIASP
jgi:hypothetical protein